MYLLYSLLILMLLSALALLALPFFVNKKLFSRYFLMTALFIIVCATGLHYVLEDDTALQQWLTHGKQHYNLQEEVAKLGGIDNIIEQIKQKLAANPDDAEGWFILGKLYLANHQYTEAKKALIKAKQLQPDHVEIKQSKFE